MTKKSRPTIGRTLNPAMFAQDDLSQATITQEKQIFVLFTGRQATFSEVFVPPESVENDTFVVEEHNGRDQAALTPESLKHIRRTIRHQQFYPAIGVRVDNRIEILDGSRRRASAILEHTGLRVLVTDQNISASEAQRLAKDLQTAEQHTIREIGLRLLRLKNSGMNQKDIAVSEGISQAKVTRALQAASAPEELITLFPVQSELTLSDYKTLCAVRDELEDKDIEITKLVTSISLEIDRVLSDDDLVEDEVKNRILRIITKETSLLTDKRSKDKPVISDLWKFDDKDRFARKRVKGRTFSYEFNRLPKEIQDELDRIIAHILKKGLGS